MHALIDTMRAQNASRTSRRARIARVAPARVFQRRKRTRDAIYARYVCALLFGKNMGVHARATSALRRGAVHHLCIMLFSVCVCSFFFVSSTAETSRAACAQKRDHKGTALFQAWEKPDRLSVFSPF